MEVWIARFIGPATRERNDNHSKNQMQWCGIARAPRRSPDAGLTDDGLLMEVRAASSRRFGRAVESRRPAARDACYVCAKCTSRRPPKAVASPRRTPKLREIRRESRKHVRLLLALHASRVRIRFDRAGDGRDARLDSAGHR